MFNINQGVIKSLRRKVGSEAFPSELARVVFMLEEDARLIRNIDIEAVLDALEEAIKWVRTDSREIKGKILRRLESEEDLGLENSEHREKFGLWMEMTEDHLPFYIYRFLERARKFYGADVKRAALADCARAEWVGNVNDVGFLTGLPLHEVASSLD